MEKDPLLMKPLVLAYIGDSVYSLYIKRKLVESSEEGVFSLHKKTCEYVKAAAQAETVKALHDSLTETEQDIVRRGRNAHAHTVPKNADVTDYRYATGFEALLGYLYISEQEERLKEILEKSYEYMSGQINEAPEERGN